ncbi:MAG TPA: mannose-1-phosphate guanylyltransferase/mannose-6-phosphate isomerase [Xanthobacteraceae bacterium]|nr:mannose-1-phosphate guanylyltransferase/mannose-6-phosphate isomerase [Xanthobacteraceae bacterium]
MAKLIHPVILCGGAGTRLWPASRDSRPKQFLKLLGPLSTLQETVKRVANPKIFGRPVIVTNRDYRFLVREQLDEIGRDAEILLEPARRDSGPAVAAASELLAARGPATLALVLAADHIVRKPDRFVAACLVARAAAERGKIVTFGCVPDSPATGYGYIKPGKPVEGVKGASEVAQFVEKPDAKTAARYIAGGYLWNSGNFLFRVDTFLAEYAAFEPASAKAIARAVKHASEDLGFRLLDKKAFAAAAQKSVDYAVMEKTRRAAVVRADYGWSDLGGWHAVWTETPRDAAGNAARGEVVLLDARDSYVASDGKLAALLGVKDLVVVIEHDAVLIADRGRAEDMRKLVDELRKKKRPEASLHARVHRPWGNYQSLDQGERFQVKRIVVKPGGRLSLQKHRRRSEHWVVVRGKARVTIGNKVRTLQENESVYVPVGSKHRLENRGKIPLELIEVQTGRYFGEDDIERFEDDYRRDKDD